MIFQYIMEAGTSLMALVTILAMAAMLTCAGILGAARLSGPYVVEDAKRLQRLRSGSKRSLVLSLVALTIAAPIAFGGLVILALQVKSESDYIEATNRLRAREQEQPRTPATDR